MRVCLHAWLHVIFMYWAIPENIHTIPQAAFWNLKSKGVGGGGGGAGGGGRGGLGTRNPKAWEHGYDWNPKGMGRGVRS